MMVALEPVHKLELVDIILSTYKAVLQIAGMGIILENFMANCEGLE